MVERLMTLISMQVFEEKLGVAAKFNIRLPAVPRKGESITLPDDHYIVDEVYWQANVPVQEPQPGYYWPDTTYYTIRLVVRKKFTGE